MTKAAVAAVECLTTYPPNSAWPQPSYGKLESQFHCMYRRATRFHILTANLPPLASKGSTRSHSPLPSRRLTTSVEHHLNTREPPLTLPQKGAPTRRTKLMAESHTPATHFV